MDLYWNYILIENDTQAIKGKLQRFTNVEVDFNKFYLHQKTNETELIYQIHLDSHGKIGLDEKELVENLHVDTFEEIFQLRTIMHVNFYSTFIMVSTAFMVAHQRLLFIYDVLEGKVVKRIDFPADIVRLQRVEVRDGVFNILAILANGALCMMVNEDEEYMAPNDWRVDEDRKIKLSGTPVQFCGDIDTQKFLAMLARGEDNKLSLHAISQGSPVTISPAI